MGLGVFLADRSLHDDAVRTRAVRRFRREVPLVPIAEARGLCRVAGRVRVLSPVPGYPKHAAFCARSVSTTTELRGRHGRERTVTVTNVTDVTHVGRFAVVDDSGVAVVEDAGAVVWQGDTEILRRGTPGSIDVKEETRVEVVGTADPGPLPQELSGYGAYRGQGTAVFMRSQGSEKVFVVVFG